MKVVLVTTAHNAVRDCLERRGDVSLHTVECSVNYAAVGERLAEAVRDLSPDIIITYRCPYIIPAEIFSQTGMGAYNIHPSLLPANAGLNPWEGILQNRETSGGVTLHKITAEVDHGPILFQRPFVIEPDDDLETARSKSDAVAAELVEQLLEQLV